MKLETMQEMTDELEVVWGLLSQENQRHSATTKELMQRLNMIQAKLSAYATVVLANQVKP